MKLTLRILNRNQKQWLIYIIVCISLFMNCLNQFLSVPGFFRYFADVCWILLFVFNLLNKKRKSRELKLIHSCLIAFFAYCAFTYIINYQSVFYFLWGTRNLFRMYVFFWACINYLDDKNIEGYLKLFDIVFAVNAVMMLIQYYFLRYYRDSLGGIFGVAVGCNGYTNMFFCMITIICAIRLFNKQIAVRKVLFYFAAMLFLSALSELKAYYVEFVLILGISFFITDFSLRKLLVVICAGTGVVITINLLISLYPIFKDAFSIKGLLAITSSDAGYTGTGDLNRLNVIKQINNRFLETAFRRIFGLGFGNCDYASNLELVTTPFYLQNVDSHYTWISYAYVYLETGCIGLFLYFGLYIIVFIQMLIRFINGRGNRNFVLISLIAAIMGIFLSIYNVSLRTEAGFLFYLLLSFGYIEMVQEDCRPDREHTPSTRICAGTCLK